jgi:probable rRNA maturation factor
VNQYSSPSISLSHRCREVPYDRDQLNSLILRGLPHCIEIAKKYHAELSSLPGIEITVLGARAMARVHRDFLGIPGATDVITFPYGEILVCAPVAAERAREFGHDTTTELALYAIHGLLHLSGHDDITPAQEKRMAASQEKILAAVLKIS